MPAPRPLSFASVAEAPDEAARLHAAGYAKRGNWDLAQVCGHLADWLGFAVAGDYPTPALARPVFWVVRHTIGPRQMRKALATGATRPGIPTAPSTVPAPAADTTAEAAAVDRLRDAVERFLDHPGEYPPSPIFGAMTREECHGLHAIHCAHHLGFLEPKAE